jgi:hypothetical protein
MSYVIICRARVSRDCYHGKPSSVQFMDDLPLTEDGSYMPDGEGGTILCDSCYLRLGMPLREYFPAVNRALAEGMDADTIRRLYGKYLPEWLPGSSLLSHYPFRLRLI